MFSGDVTTDTIPVLLRDLHNDDDEEDDVGEESGFNSRKV